MPPSAARKQPTAEWLAPVKASLTCLDRWGANSGPAIAAQSTVTNGLSELDRGECRKATGRVVQSYREAMIDFAGWRTTDIWYAVLKAKDIVAWADSQRGAKRVANSGAESGYLVGKAANNQRVLLKHARIRG